jgi:ATP adenylyltransferase
MNNIWAPWRIDYIRGPRPAGCVFCRAAEEDSDRENLVLIRGEYGMIILNRYPYNNGHLMVVPYAHVPTIEEMPAEVLGELMAMVQRGIGLLRRAMGPDGFNVGINLGGAAGAGMADHVHIHIVPRWNGDTNYMTVVGQTRVIPDGLFCTYDCLAEAMQGNE